MYRKSKSINLRKIYIRLNTYRLIRRTGWLLIYTSRTNDGCPFKPKKLSVPFLDTGVPAGLAPFRELVPLGRRNMVPILPPAHPLDVMRPIEIVNEVIEYADSASGPTKKWSEKRIFRCLLRKM
jgi:hypothetical protein